MGKYTHWNAQEIRSEIEKFGTEDEQDIMRKFCADPDWSECPNCAESWSCQEVAEAALGVASEELEILQAATKPVYEKMLSAIDLLEEAVKELEP